MSRRQVSLIEKPSLGERLVYQVFDILHYALTIFAGGFLLMLAFNALHSAGQAPGVGFWNCTLIAVALYFFTNAANYRPRR